VTLRATAIRFVAALTLASAATIGTGGQPAVAATAPTHVAIVVANVGHACVPYHSGMTGGDVLSSNFNVLYGGPPRYVGFVLQINGVGTTQPDLTHYWAYYHNTGGGWAYSGSGATSYTPQPGTVEGWAYDNSQQSPPTPPSMSYAAICGGQDPTPPPTHAPTQPPVASHPSPPSAAQPGQPGQPGQPAPTTASSATSPSATSPGAHSTSPAKRRSSVVRARPTNDGTESPDSSTPNGSQPAAELVEAKQGGQHTSAAPGLGTGLALLAVAALGGTAFWRLRRQNHG
jgi:hypothetical protein